MSLLWLIKMCVFEQKLFVNVVYSIDLSFVDVVFRKTICIVYIAARKF